MRLGWRDVRKRLPWVRARPELSKDDFEAAIHFKSLRFHDSDVERGFVESHRAQLEKSVFVATILLGLLGAYAMFVTHKYLDTDQYPNEDVYRVSRMQLLAQSTFVGGTLALLSVFNVLSRSKFIGAHVFEIGVVCASGYLQISHWMVQKHYMAKLCGFPDPDELWGLDLGGSDSSVLMWNSVCQCSMFVAIPVRWKLLLPYGCLSLLNYAVPAYVVGSPDRRRATENLLALICLSVLMSFGKRFDERKERRLHWTLLREKRLRFQAEFALSQGGVTFASSGRGAASGVSDCGPDTNASSVQRPPSTTATGQVFESAHQDAAACFGQLVDLGRREQWLIVEEELQQAPERVLGSGGFGRVIAGVYQGVDVAVKSPKPEAKSRNVVELCNELRILRRLRHPHIVALYGAVVELQGDELQLGLVLELISGSRLDNYLSARAASAVDSQRAHLMLQVSSALCYLHSRSPVVIHGDLKASNIFVECRADGKPHAKLLDFGLSRMVTGRARHMGGTLRWMAPELLRHQCAPHPEADVFSFGRIVYFISTTQLPFKDKTGKSLRQLLVRCPELHWPAALQQDPLGRTLIYLVEQCTKQETPDRPVMSEVHACLGSVAKEADDSTTNGELWSSGGKHAELQPRASTPSDNVAKVSSRQALQDKVNSTMVEGRDDAQGSNIPSGAASSRDRRGQLVEPSMPPTPAYIMQLRLQGMVWQCNFARSPGSCCRFHDGLKVISETIQEQLASPCEAAGPPVRGQCPSCMLLAFEEGDGACEEDTCEFCGAQLHMKGMPFPPTPEASQSRTEV